MAALDDTLKGNFETEVIKSRETAEIAARAALATLAVERDRPFDSMNEEKRAVRRALRARARQLGEGDMGTGIPRLIEEIAYEHWHRMLFARFLAENNLLLHPAGVPVTLEECAELAEEQGAEDMWAVATRYASAMLPGIFREDDPALQVRFAPEGRHKLEQIISYLPEAIFTSDDGLGWAYQFWQSRKKDEVNRSERKIGGSDIAPVTQLFTEDYMVKFLLHNTLGAWWAHRHPDSPLNETFEYLRYRNDGIPAAGTFDGWPDKVAEVTMMDPCGGSGHFVVAAFEMLYRMRMEEDRLCATEAGELVIRDNVHMLEIDLRCTQIASFNLALAAWKSGGYRELPLPNIACSGIPIQGQLEDWTSLAGDNEALRWSLGRLFQLFSNASDLGSLIDPTDTPLEERMFIRDLDDLLSLMETALEFHHDRKETSAELANRSVCTTALAARLLSRQYTLVVTNVPYLGFKKQSRYLKEYCQKKFPDSRMDLATCFLERCRFLTCPEGHYALVSIQNWLFLKSYEGLRIKLLNQQRVEVVARLGESAFESSAAAGAFVAMCVLQNREPTSDQILAGLDASKPRSPNGKSKQLLTARLAEVEQNAQFSNPDSRIVFSLQGKGVPIEKIAECYQGIVTGDIQRFTMKLWEVPLSEGNWVPFRRSNNTSDLYGDVSEVLLWEEGRGQLHTYARETRDRLHDMHESGNRAWGKLGVAVNRMRDLKAVPYYGEHFDNNVAVVVPKKRDETNLALLAFLRSHDFTEAVRRLDQTIKVTNRTLLKVPFELEKWIEAAKEQYPDGIPEPTSNDPTQWMFDGDLRRSSGPLQVAMARLLGFQWPRQRVADALDEKAYHDGIVCLVAVTGELSASERLRSLLSTSYSNAWSMSLQRQLVADAGFRVQSLETYIRDGFFKQHCKLFKNRPFIWHIWDGRNDGFSALVNYHKLDHAKLERLIYTYLGAWINTQRAEHEQGVPGAEGRLWAALELKKKLELILEGEPPYDIYVRWKPLHEQAIGWNPDLNDGVRLNIRPFVKAGVLRSKFTIHWKKDRGKNPDGSERINDRHFTRAQKLQARREAGIEE